MATAARAASGLLIAIVWCLSACADPSVVPESHHDAGVEAGCSAGELPRSGGCQPAGLPPDMPCPPGELALEGGGCQPAGVPPSACAPGFMPDDGGCEPTLPVAPCSPGTMAVPGDTACHEIAPCGQGTWGDIPVETDTEFVDWSYPGNDSDGTLKKPWKTIQQGIDAAAPGAIVAVAEGPYQENLAIDGKAVRLWGRCPAKVDVVGGLGAPTITIDAGADGSEVHGVTVTGPLAGIYVYSANDVVIDGVGVYNAGRVGVVVEQSSAGFVLRGSLIESAHDTGLRVARSAATVSRSVIRHTTFGIGGLRGFGVDAFDGEEANQRSTVTIEGSLIEGNRGSGILVLGSTLTLDASVVRDTLLDAEGTSAGGLNIWNGTERAEATIRRSVIERNPEVNIYAEGADLVVEDSVVRGQVGSDADEPRYGLYVRDSLTGERSDATVRASLFDKNGTDGVLILGSDASVAGALVRDGQSGANGTGRGIAIADNPATGQRSRVSVIGSVVTRNLRRGVLVYSSDAVIESTIVSDTLSDAEGQLGRGIDVTDLSPSKTRASASIRACRIEGNHEVGVSIMGSSAVVEESLVLDTVPLLGGALGRGINAQDNGGPAKATIRLVRIERSGETGIMVINSSAIIDASVISETRPNGAGRFGDGIVLVEDAVSHDIVLTSLRLEGNARAGLANFSAHAKLGASALTCNGFDIDGESGFSFETLGHNVCGCPTADRECKIESTNLTPPSALPPDTE